MRSNEPGPVFWTSLLAYREPQIESERRQVQRSSQLHCTSHSSIVHSEVWAVSSGTRRTLPEVMFSVEFCLCMPLHTFPTAQLIKHMTDVQHAVALDNHSPHQTPSKCLLRMVDTMTSLCAKLSIVRFPVANSVRLCCSICIAAWAGSYKAQGTLLKGFWGLTFTFNQHQSPRTNCWM